MRLADPRLKSRRPIRFRFDGETVEAIEGETVGAALAAAGRLALRKTRSGAPRGLHCGMGACFDCVVTIDGRIGQRACLEKVSEGSDVRSGPPEAEALHPLAAMPTGIAEIRTDVLVVGAGPAGLTAALGLARAGARVIVADERPAAGGQYFKPLAASWQAEEPLDRQFAAGATLVAEAIAEGVEIWQGAVVWLASIEDGFGIQHAGETRIVRPRATILATGAHETAAPMPGWTLPGVMTTGGLQTLVRSYRVSPSQRVVIAGNGPLNLQLACELVRAGIRPLAVVEAAAAPVPGRLGAALRMAAADPGLALEGLRYLLLLRKAGVPVLWRSRVVGIEGETCAAAAVIAGPAGTRRIEADIVTLGYGFTPQAELARQLGCRVSGPAGACRVETDAMGRTSLAGVLAIGDGSAIGGARVAAAQGALAAIAAAEHLRIGTGEIAEQPAATATLARHRRFQRALWQAFAPVSRPGPLADETIACRCEEVSAGAIRRACRAEGASFAVVKRLTRAGMGRCQARFCAGTLAGLIEAEGGVAEAGFAPRAPAKPVPLAALALEKGEWGGHRLATPPAASPRAPRSRELFGTLRTDVAVIGAGVVGCCVARELAERGIAVTVLDRHEPNLQASGANAGSLHVQLLSFDFGSKAQAGGGPAAQTLRLGPIAVALWQAIERASGETLEIATPGGLMVAETAEELAFLEQKAALERSHGIDTQVIGANELRALEPQLSGDLVGAAFCAQEGKINPLTATYAVARLARLAGARFESFASVTAIGREGEGWRIETEAGAVLARRVVNAAGGWSSRISAMAGRPIPVHGAPLQMIVTEPGPKLVRHLVAHAGRHLSLKQADTGGLIIGGGWTAGLDEASGASRALRSSIEGNAYVACRVLPAARGLHALRIWAGMNVNIDGAPIIGEMPGAPGFYNCVTSNGYTLAPAVSRITAELVADGRSELALPAYQLSRFG